jgi:hypothetical protein
MGNIQNYCGSNCKEIYNVFNINSNSKIKEEIINVRTGANKDFNDHQKKFLNKLINSWKKIQKEKKDPFSTKNLTKKIEKIDEYIKEKQGKFVDLKTFENLINKEIYNLYTKLSIKEQKYGFKSFRNKSNLNSFQTPIDSKEEYISTENQLNFLFLRRPVILEETGDIYLGYWNLQGEREGYGKLVNNNGILIEGYFEPHGFCKYGRYFFPNGTYYEGNLENNLPNTAYENGNMNYNNQKDNIDSKKGELKLFENDIYKGEWLNGKFKGKGLLFISNKCKYEGEFKDSLFSGQGNLTYSDIDEYNYFYEGQFENNKFEGEGYFKFQLNEKNEDQFEDYNGQWKNGLPNGKGIYTWKGGIKYVGAYLDGKKEGYGKYIFNSGNSYYTGNWSNGKPNGRGQLKLNENIKLSGDWRQGKINKIESLNNLSLPTNYESMLDFHIENEMFSNDFFLNINYITPEKENPKQIFFADETGKIIQNSKALKISTRILEKNIRHKIEKN